MSRSRRLRRACMNGWEYWGKQGFVLNGPPWAARQVTRWSLRWYHRLVRREGKRVIELERKEEGK